MEMLHCGCGHEMRRWKWEIMAEELRTYNANCVMCRTCAQKHGLLKGSRPEPYPAAPWRPKSDGSISTTASEDTAPALYEKHSQRLQSALRTLSASENDDDDNRRRVYDQINQQYEQECAALTASV